MAMIVNELNKSSRTWSNVHTEGTILISRCGHSTTLVGRNLVIFGGKDGSGIVLNDLHIPNMETMCYLKAMQENSTNLHSVWILVEAAEDGLPARMVSGRHCTVRLLMGGSSPLTGNAASPELRVTTQLLDGVPLSAGEALRPGSCQAVGAAEMLGEMPLRAEPSGDLVETNFRAGEGNVGGLGCPDSARGEEEAPSLDAASPAQPVQQLRGDGDLLNSGIVTGYVASGSEFHGPRTDQGMVWKDTNHSLHLLGVPTVRARSEIYLKLSEIGCLCRDGLLSEIKRLSDAKVQILPKENHPPGISEADELVQIVGEITEARKALLQVTAELRSYLYRDFFVQKDMLPPSVPAQIHVGRVPTVETGSPIRNLPLEGYLGVSPTMPASQNVHNATATWQSKLVFESLR